MQVLCRPTPNLTHQALALTLTLTLTNPPSVPHGLTLIDQPSVPHDLTLTLSVVAPSSSQSHWPTLNPSVPHGLTLTLSALHLHLAATPSTPTPPLSLTTTHSHNYGFILHFFFSFFIGLISISKPIEYFFFLGLCNIVLVIKSSILHLQLLNFNEKKEILKFVMAKNTWVVWYVLFYFIFLIEMSWLGHN